MRRARGGSRGNQRAARERRRDCSEKVETHPTDTLASPDEFAMNSWPTCGQLPRIPIPRTRVNKGRNRRKLAATQFAPTANKRLYFVDERQQVLKRWVEPPP